MRKDKLNRLTYMRRLTRLSILAENTAMSFWPLLLWILSGFTFLLLFPNIGNFSESAFFFIFWGGTIYFLIKGAMIFHWPRRAEIDRRLEQVNNYTETPLSVYDDKLANSEKRFTRLLWSEQQNRLKNILKGIRADYPKTNLSRKDPYALRYAVFLIFTAAFIMAGGDRWQRIESGLHAPDFSFTSNKKSTVEIWITPPAYTHLPQITLNTADKKTINMPAGSMLKASIHGGIGTPVLQMGHRQLKFKKSGTGNYTIETEIINANSIRIQQLYLQRASWTYNYIPDAPPQISLAKPYEALDDGSLRFSLNVKDDYGIASITMYMSQNMSVPSRQQLEPYEETRSVSSPAGEEIEINPLYDLTFHRWAGLPAAISFEVTDGSGNIAKLAPQNVTLPEKNFTHPVAREIIRIRKELLQDENIEPIEHARQLENILIRPFYFQDDITVFMAIRAASSRLVWSKPTDETRQSVIDLLWDIAIKIEDGDISMAQTSLREAKAALEKALSDPTSTHEDIARLTDNLRSAMEEYLSALQQNIARKMNEGGQIMQVPPELMAQLMNPGSIAGMLDQMQADMQSGDRQAAQNMLSKLGQMLDFLNPSMVRKLPEDMQMMGESINILQQMIEVQQQIFEQTLAIEDNAPAEKEWDQQTRLREALQKITGQAAKKIKEMPPSLKSAEKNMGLAATSLKESHAPIATLHQEKAIEDLKNAKKELGDQLSARLKQMTGISFGANGMRYDPLGRQMGGQGNPFTQDSNVRIPDEAERRQAQEILEILRARSGEMNRPEIELEYYRRLLKFF